MRALEVYTGPLLFPPKLTFLVVVLSVFPAGVFWEILEFTVDGIAGAFGTGGLVLAQDGLQDTMSDLLAVTVGTVLMADAATLYRRPERDRLRDGGRTASSVTGRRQLRRTQKAHNPGN